MGVAQMSQVIEVEQVTVDQFNDVGTLLAQAVSLEAELRKTRELLYDASEALEYYADKANVVVCAPGASEIPLLLRNGYTIQSDGATYVEGGQYAQAIFNRIEKYLPIT